MPQSYEEDSLNKSQAKSLPKVKNQSTTLFQNMVTGSVAGATEVLVDHPLWSIKTRLQSGDPFTLKPSTLYRGILPNAASMIPITAIQVTLNSCIKDSFLMNTNELSNTQQMASAFVAGVGSSVISCPTEMVMTHQSKTGQKFLPTGRYLFKHGGYQKLFTGLPATSMREGVFSAFYLAASPILKSNIRPYCPNEDLSSVAGGLTSGIGAAVVSQGVDTVKAIQQLADPLHPVSFKNAANNLYSSKGIYGFFKGGIPRGLRVMSAVTIMGWVNEKMERKFTQK